MKCKTRAKRFAAVWVALSMIFSSLAALNIADNETILAASGDSGLIFSGFELSYGEDGTIQALVDVSVNGYYANGLGVVLQYDPRYIVPSNAETNENMEEATPDEFGTVDSTPVFKQNTAVIPDGFLTSNEWLSFIDTSSHMMYLTVGLNQEITDVSGHEYLAAKTRWEGGKPAETHIAVDAVDRTLSLGKLSFKIVDTTQVFGMDSASLQNILKLYPDTNSGAELSYIDVTDGQYKQVNNSVPTTWEVERTLLSAEPKIEETTVSAYSLYNRCQSDTDKGTLEDLFAYLNQTMGYALMSYSDGNREINRIIWSSDEKVSVVNRIESEPAVEVTHTNDQYEPKGDVTYEISQYYGYGSNAGEDIRSLTDEEKTELENYKVTVIVHVTPSTLLRFDYNDRIKSYLDDVNRPQILSDFNMPDPVIPVISGVDDMYIPPYEHPGTDWTERDASVDIYHGSAPVSQTFDHEVSQSLFDDGSGLPAWLTLQEQTDPVWDVDAIRNILPDGTYIPDPEDDDTKDKATAWVDTIGSWFSDGKLFIELTYNDGDYEFPTGTNFKVYLPNGWVLDTTGETTGLIKIDSSDTKKPVIIIDALYSEGDDYPSDGTNEAYASLTQRLEMQKLINAGSSDFKISALIDYSGTVIETAAAPFSFDPRRNDYLKESGIIYPAALEAEGQTKKTIDKDYSGFYAPLFPVYEGQNVSDIATYIALPGVNDTVPTVYDGKTGEQTSELSAVKVESWTATWTDSSSVTHTGETTLPEAGTTVYLEGKLAPYYYTDFGYVENTYNVWIRLKLTTLADLTAAPTPEPSETPDPDASPSPTPDPDASPTPTPQPKEGIEISTRVPKSDDGTYVVLNSKTFEYDTKKYDSAIGGYTPVQNQQYKLTNIGTDDIKSLTVRIAEFSYIPSEPTETPWGEPAASSPISYIIGDNKVYEELSSGGILPNIVQLDSGGEAYVDIRTRGDLPVGIYEAKVLVGSSHTDELAWFNVRFKVTDKDVYTVTIDNEETSEVGMGYLMSADGDTICSNTYAKGETVNLNVEIIDPAYIFHYWEQTAPTDTDHEITFADYQSAATTFKMTDADVTVKPYYQPNTYLYLRLADLRDYNKDSTTPNTLCETDPPYSPKPFKESDYEYRVTVDGNVEQNYVEFELKDTLLGATPSPMAVKMTLSNRDNPTPTEIPCTAQAKQAGQTETTTYKSDLFDLVSGSENTVTITTTYEDADGNTFELTYTLIIMRKTAVNVTFRPGNSPYGIIAQSDNIQPSDKPAVQEKFKTDRLYDTDNPPNRAVTTMHTRYAKEAWQYEDSGAYKYDDKEDYDCDEDALFVYEGEPFVDPGFTELHSVYEPEATINPEKVTRTIKDVSIYTAAPVAVGNMIDNVPTPTDIPVAASPQPDGRILVEELVGKTIRPGVYSLEYEFEDSDGSQVTFSRNMIIIPKKGDVNLDGNSNTLDADIIYQRLNNTYYTPAPTATPDPSASPTATPTPDPSASPSPTPIVLTYTPTDANGDGKVNDSFYAEIIYGKAQWTQLMAYRVGDVTEDMNINSADANAVLVTPLTAVTMDDDAWQRQYYEQLPKTLTDVQATVDPITVSPHPTGEPVPSATPRPVLTLDYLGSDLSNPSDTDQSDMIFLDEDSVYEKNPDTGEIYGDIVWLGVGIRNAQNLEYFVGDTGLYSVDIAIDYDPNILLPCDKNRTLPNETGFDLAGTITEKNISGTDTMSKTNWAYASLYNASLQTHLDLDVTDRYNTEFVTIKSTNTTRLRLQETGTETIDPDATYYLLRVPFVIVSWPDENYTGLAATLNLTENTFVIGSTEDGVTHSASWESPYDDATDSYVTKNKTTAVNNAENHFDLDITDIFNTNETFRVQGTLRGWNPQNPFVVEFFKVSDGVLETTPEKTFESTEKDSVSGEYVYGPSTFWADGSVEWAFDLPVPAHFNYIMVISKQSHVTYPDIWIENGAKNSTNGVYDTEFDLDLLVGDVNEDGFIKVPDREGIMRFLYQQKPWALYRDRFEEADLNGDDLVNMFDLNLWKANMGSEYALPAPTPTEAPGGGDGG